MTALRIVALSVLLAATALLRDAASPLSAALVWALCLLVLVRSHPNRLLSLAPLYLLLLGMFHLGLVVPLDLHLVAAEPPGWMGSRQLGTSLWLFTMAVAAFTLGARLRPGEAPEARSERELSQPQLLWVGLAVAAVGATLLWIGVVQRGILETTYFERYERALTEDFRFYLFGRFLFPIGLLVASGGATRRQMLWLGLLFLAVLGPVFMGGSRGHVIVQAVSFLAVWAVKDRAVARRVAVVVAVVVVALVPAVRMARNVEGASVTSSMGSVDPIFVLLEAGGSMQPLVVTAERIESGSERLWMGRSYRQGLGRVLLNVSAQRAAGDAHDLFPNAWATMHADYGLFLLGGGIGYSGVAEPYLNFGPTGVVVFFVLLGLFIGACERWLASDPFRAAIAAATFAFVLWTVRDDSIPVPRALTIACSTVFVAWLATRVSRAVQRTGAEPGALGGLRDVRGVGS